MELWKLLLDSHPPDPFFLALLGWNRQCSSGRKTYTDLGVGLGLTGRGVWALLLASSSKQALRPDPPRARHKAKINKEESLPFEIVQYIALCPLSTVIAHAAFGQRIGAA